MLERGCVKSFGDFPTRGGVGSTSEDPNTQPTLTKSGQLFREDGSRFFENATQTLALGRLALGEIGRGQQAAQCGVAVGNRTGIGTIGMLLTLDALSRCM